MITCCRYNIEIRHLHFLWCYTVMLHVCNFFTYFVICCALCGSLTFNFDGTESNGLKYGDKPGGFVKSPGSVVVVRIVSIVLRDTGMLTMIDGPGLTDDSRKAR